MKVTAIQAIARSFEHQQNCCIRGLPTLLWDSPNINFIHFEIPSFFLETQATLFPVQHLILTEK